MYLKEDDITDINMIDEYNDDYKRIYSDFKPFVTKENFASFLKALKIKRMVLAIMASKRFSILLLKMIR